MKSIIKIIIAMLIYGSIGVFVKNINVPPIELAFLRALIGSIFLFIAGFIMNKKYSKKSIKENLVLLIISGSAMAVNWVFLFKAFEYISVSNATLVYYLAPVFMIILSSIFLKEKLNMFKLLCVAVALVGLFLIINDNSKTIENSKSYIMGIIYSLSAAILYASVIIMNKKIKDLSGFHSTLFQLVFSTIILLPVVLVRSNLSIERLNNNSIIYIAILGILHTGVAYLLYFSAVKEMKAQSVAIFCYIDPVSAVVFASIFLGEALSLYGIIGGLLILGSTFVSERGFRFLKAKSKIQDIT